MDNKEFEKEFGQYEGEYPSLKYYVYEGMIKRAVRKSLDKLIEEKSLLREFYGDRQDFYKRVYSRIEQLFQNFCLIKYGEAKGLQTLNHWYGEYDEIIRGIYDFSITENNSPKYRFKVINKAFTDRLDKFENMVRTFKNTKLKDERIRPNDELMNEIIYLFPSKVETIILYLAHITDRSHEEFI